MIFDEGGGAGRAASQTTSICLVAIGGGGSGGDDESGRLFMFMFELVSAECLGGEGFPLAALPLIGMAFEAVSEAFDW